MTTGTGERFGISKLARIAGAVVAVERGEAHGVDFIYAAYAPEAARGPEGDTLRKIIDTLRKSEI